MLIKPLERTYTPRHSTILTDVAADPIYVADLASDAAAGFAPEDGFDSIHPTGDAWLVGNRVWVAYTYDGGASSVFLTRGADDEFPVMADSLNQALEMTA